MKMFRRTEVLFRTALCLVLMLATTAVARAQAMKVEAELIWATDDQQSPDPTHHPIDPDLAHQLGKAPYRWKNYFEVNRLLVDIKVGESKTVVMSKRCTLDIKNLDASRVEVKLHGDGKPVSTHKESLAKNWRLILSGDAGNQTAWLVSVRKADATASMPPFASSGNSNPPGK